MSLLKGFKTEYELIESENSKLSKKEKLIREIEREIDLVNKRKNLNILKIEKKLKGEITEVNENRYWKKDKDDNYILVTLKYKGVIIGLENKKMNYRIENEKDKLIKFLNSIKFYLNGIDINDEVWEKVKI